MKDFKETENRISNLKNMINQMNEEENDDRLEYNISDEEIEEDEELINYLNENNDSFEMNDEYIYRPGKDSPSVINLEDAEIDENFIIEADINEDITEKSQIVNKPTDFDEEINENFDNLINFSIGEKPILAFVSLILGIIFIIASVLVFNARSDRIIDNVVSGENHFIMVVLILIGILLIIYGIFKIFNIKSPFDNMIDSINTIEEEKENLKKEEEKKEEEHVIPKSNIPLDKESYKIGEFDMNELKNNLKSSFSKTLDKTDEPEETTTEKINVDDLPHAREKSEDQKGLIKEEIEEIYYEKAQLDGESIDEIFADVEDLPEDQK